MKNTKKQAFMGRGTTPCINFTYPKPIEDVEKIYATFYGMQSKEKIEKFFDYQKDKNEHINLIDGFIEVNFTQEDTLQFFEDEKIMMSLKVKLKNATVLYCPPMYTYMGRVLKEDKI